MVGRIVDIQWYRLFVVYLRCMKVGTKIEYMGVEIERGASHYHYFIFRQCLFVFSYICFCLLLLTSNGIGYLWFISVA